MTLRFEQTLVIEVGESLLHYVESFDYRLMMFLPNGRLRAIIDNLTLVETNESPANIQQ